MKKSIFISLCVVAALCASCTKSNPYLGKIPALAIAAGEKENKLIHPKNGDEMDKNDEKLAVLEEKTNKKIAAELKRLKVRQLPFVCADGLKYKVDSVVLADATWHYVLVEVYAEFIQPLDTSFLFDLNFRVYYKPDVYIDLAQNTQRCAVFDAQSQCLGTARSVRLDDRFYADEYFPHLTFTVGQKIVARHLLDARKCADFDHLEFVDEATYKSLR